MANLGDELVAAGKLTPGQVRRALAFQARFRCRFGEACVLQGLLGATELLPTLATRLRVPYVFIGTRTIPDALLALLPGQVIRQRRVLPIRAQLDARGRKTVYIATAEPQDLALLDELGVIMQAGVRGVLATNLDLHRALERHGLLDGRKPTPAPLPASAWLGFEVQRSYLQ